MKQTFKVKKALNQDLRVDPLRNSDYQYSSQQTFKNHGTSTVGINSSKDHIFSQHIGQVCITSPSDETFDESNKQSSVGNQIKEESIKQALNRTHLFEIKENAPKPEPKAKDRIDFVPHGLKPFSVFYMTQRDQVFSPDQVQILPPSQKTSLAFDDHRTFTSSHLSSDTRKQEFRSLKKGTFFSSRMRSSMISEP